MRHKRRERRVVMTRRHASVLHSIADWLLGTECGQFGGGNTSTPFVALVLLISIPAFKVNATLSPRIRRRRVALRRLGVNTLYVRAASACARDQQPV